MATTLQDNGKKRCRLCGDVLTDDNQYPSMQKSNCRVCKTCHSKRTIARQKANRVPPAPRVLPDKDVLYKLYVEDRKTQSAIGAMYGVGMQKVSGWLKLYNIPMRTMSESWDIRREIHNTLFDQLDGVDREETIRRFGYDPVNMSYGSNNLIVVVCPECGDAREVRAYGYKSGQLCRSCSKTGERHPMWGKHSAVLGRHHTEETKQLISKNRTGKGTGSNNTHYGKSLSPETKEKLRVAMTGRKWSDEVREKMTGENSPRWRGGITPKLYCSKWTEELRETIRDKFGRMCFLCGKSEEDNGAKLSVHHTNSGKQCLCEYSCELVPLCRQCHGKVGTNRFHWYSLIMCKLLLESSAQHIDIVPDL